RLECALHRAHMAPDPPIPPTGLAHLGDRDPASVVLVPTAAMALIESKWPVLRIHAAHARDAPSDAFAAARRALANGESDAVVVWREGYRTRADAVAATDLAWWRALMAQVSLAEALDQAGAVFNFQDWLLQALVKLWLAEVRLIDLPTPDATAEPTS
ncbi:MAG: hypothetical protein ACKVQR_11015, partial [Aquabacterium sp.]